MHDGLLPDPSPRLEAAFRAARDGPMRGLPFVNPALDVEAVDFAPWKSCWLGVMVTPWSMNLMLLPHAAAAWRPLAPGAKRRYAFAAGAFDFIGACDETIGDYLVCSLFSPMQAFADHATAVATARLARAALFDAAHAEAPTEAPVARAAQPGPLARLEAQLGEPITRRELLYRRMAGDRDVPRR